MDKSLGDFKLNEPTKTQVNEIRLVSNFTSLDMTKLFDMMANVQNYTVISPKHFVSVTIVNQSGNVIYAKEQIKEKFFTETVLVKHTIVPYYNQTMEVMDGDAKGTILVASFNDSKNKQTLTTNVKLHLTGKLALFAFLPKQTLEQELISIESDFVNYSIGFNDKYDKIVDDLYREILHRPADEVGLKFFSSRLEAGQMSVDDIRKTITESPEAQSLKKG